MCGLWEPGRLTPRCPQTPAPPQAVPLGVTPTNTGRYGGARFRRSAEQPAITVPPRTGPKSEKHRTASSCTCCGLWRGVVTPFPKDFADQTWGTSSPLWWYQPPQLTPAPRWLSWVPCCVETLKVCASYRFQTPTKLQSCHQAAVLVRLRRQKRPPLGKIG